MNEKGGDLKSSYKAQYLVCLVSQLNIEILIRILNLNIQTGTIQYPCTGCAVKIKTFNFCFAFLLLLFIVSANFLDLAYIIMTFFVGRSILKNMCVCLCVHISCCLWSECNVSCLLFTQLIVNSASLCKVISHVPTQLQGIKNNE